MKEFNHLHVHSEYSLLDGANKISSLVAAAKADGQKSLAITDHGNMFGALEFYNECRKQDIKPIIGCEFYIAKASHLSKHTRANGYNHLTLLARNETGFKNLMKLTSISYIEGLSNRPRISLEVLASQASGIICLSGCLSGRVNELLLENREPEAMQVIDNLRSIFGKEYFWLELQRNGLTIQDKATTAMVRMSREMDIPLVATNDIHYLRHEDCDFQDTMLCINTGAMKSEPNRFRFDSDTMYFKTSEEMNHVFRDLPEAIKTTLDVSSMVDLKIQQGNFHFPKSGYDNPNEVLTGICKQKISERELGTAYSARLDHELKVIHDLGFSEYFLVVKDLVEYARTSGIPVGPGRGSAAGCLISFLLGITNLDPLRYGLLFERFINSERKGLPDVDIDFCQKRRWEIVDYLKDKYGDDKVASIITFNRFGPKKSIRQVAKVLEVGINESDIIAKKMIGDTLEESISKDSSLAEDEKKYPGLFKVSRQLEGYVEYIGVHASGIIISDRPLYEVVPLARINRTGDDGTVVTQWDLEFCEKIGLVKFDILGLETLTIIDIAERLIKDRHGIKLSIDSVPLDEPKVYQLLSSGDTEGVFQCYSDGMKKLLMTMKPDKFTDIIAAIALFRPGPLESGIVEQYVARKHGLEPVSYTHPDLQDVMESTYGTMVYQEQIMRLASVLAGFSLNQADELRKAVGKKLPELLAEIKDRFLKGCKALGKVPEEVANKIWDDIEKFGRYGFNMSHSASYGYITYYTAYLKCKYPVEFACANLTQELSNTDKLKAHIVDAKKHNISVLGPDIRTSKTECTIVDNSTIRLGFGAVKGIGNHLNDLASNIDLSGSIGHVLRALGKERINKRVFESLARAGVFDHLGHSRKYLVDNSSYILKKLTDRVEGLHEIFADDEEDTFDLPLGTDTKEDILLFEKEAFDFYLSGHPMDDQMVKMFITGCRPIASLLKAKDNVKNVKTAGVITSLEIKGVKAGKNKGRKYARMTLEDQHSQGVAALFTSNYDKYIAICQEARQNARPVTLYCNVDAASEVPLLSIFSVNYLDDELRKTEDIKIPISIGDEDKLPAIRKIVDKFPGDKLLNFVIRVDTSPTIIRTPIQVSLCEDFVKEIQAVI